jgi:predicted GIY-YIG superfamily endonuclease
MTERTALYRLYDAQDTLLYVGISGNPPERWNTHRADHGWWPSVARKTVEWFDTRRDAARAEAIAVRAEAPIHNKALPDEDGLEGWRLAVPREKRPTKPGQFRRIRVDDMWDRFGQAIREAEPELDRSRVIREMVRWYIGETDDLPRRPRTRQ